ncbi:MAG: caspase family protein [Burkholderiaceae bacterium]
MCEAILDRWLRRVAGRWWAAALLLVASAVCAQEPSRGSVVDEQRVALVIGQAAYRAMPALDNAANDARLIARTLEQAGFRVTLREDLTRTAMLGALRQFGDQLGERSVAVLYYAGHGIQLRDRNFMMPVDAEVLREEDVELHGVDIDNMLQRMAKAKSRVNVVILDACRDNPLAKAGSVAGRGLAQMDAPVGTFLAFATAPGKSTPDNEGGGSNSLYTASLARHMLTRGLAIELMFKRVREDVVRLTRQRQVPWEHSSLTGEFAFVPGAAAVAATPVDSGADAELALWQRAEASTRADELRAYLRQYPDGAHAAAARARLASLQAVPAGAAADLMPHVGDTWRYRITDQFRFGDLFVTARVDAVTPEGVAETWTSTADAKVRTTLVPLTAGFSQLPGWDSAPPEFAPYLQAGARGGGAPPLPGPQQRRIDAVNVALQAQWLGDEEVEVAAGRFATRKLRLRGEAPGRRLSAEHTVWYAPSVRRIVKYQVQTLAGRALRESTTFELADYKLN